MTTKKENYDISNIEKMKDLLKSIKKTNIPKVETENYYLGYVKNR